jgi:glycosyltransferase involved in cell wall biosynthesis
VAGRVARLAPEARFVIAGTGEMLPRIIERGIELGLADRLHVAGGLTGSDVERAFRMASVCVMPSVSEPFGLVVLESLRAGTPCIIPRESGAAEVVRNALRADFWDIERMTDQVVGLLRHPILREELSERGRVEISRPQFGLEEPARRTAHTYRRAIQEACHA